MKFQNRYSSRLNVCIPVVSCLILTILGYGPTELYLSNRGAEEFWFSYGELVLPLILTAAIAFAVLIIILMVLPKKFYRAILAALIAIAALFMAQSLFLPNNYGSLNGTEINWSLYRLRLVTNTTIWTAVIAAAVIWALCKWKSFRDAARFEAVLLIVMQAVLLVTVGITGNRQKAKENTTAEDIYLTTDNEFTVSGSRNTIVIILDAFDAALMCDLLEQYPEELQTSFEDFTFYHNTNGGATRTKYAIPYILTGRINDTGRSYSEYLKESFSQSPLFQELNTGKYSTGVYTEYAYVDRTQSTAIDNLSSGGEMHAISQWGLANCLLKMTAFKYAPHVLKPIFWMYSFELTQWRGGEKGGSTAYKLDDVKFYQSLKKKGLSVLGREPAFRFIHLKGAHGPFVMDETIRTVPHKQSIEKEQKQALGSLRIVSEYIQQLKKLGLYENATMFVLADHGDKTYVQPNYEQNPLLMVKVANTKKHFSVSDIPLSYRDLPNMLEDSLRNRLNIEENYAAEGNRYFYVGTRDSNSYGVTEYVSAGNAYDATSYRETGKIYRPEQGDSRAYKLGELLYFGDTHDVTAQKYMVRGFSIDADYAWSDGKDVEMNFDLGEVGKNLKLSLVFKAAMNRFQRCYLYANSTPIGNFAATRASMKSFIIPKEEIINGSLAIRMLLPDCYNPATHGTGADDRDLGICFFSVQIDATDESFDLGKQTEIEDYDLGQEITFGEDGNMDDYAIDGISQDHWTSGRMASIHFRDIDAKKDLALVISYNKVYGERQHVIILANEKQIADYVAEGSEEKVFSVPLALLQDNALDVEIHLPDAKKPDNGDQRELALWMKSIVLREADTLSTQKSLYRFIPQ